MTKILTLRSQGLAGHTTYRVPLDNVDYWYATVHQNRAMDSVTLCMKSGSVISVSLTEQEMLKAIEEAGK